MSWIDKVDPTSVFTFAHTFGTDMPLAKNIEAYLMRRYRANRHVALDQIMGSDHVYTRQRSRELKEKFKTDPLAQRLAQMYGYRVCKDTRPDELKEDVAFLRQEHELDSKYLRDSVSITDRAEWKKLVELKGGTWTKGTAVVNCSDIKDRVNQFYADAIPDKICTSPLHGLSAPFRGITKKFITKKKVCPHCKRAFDNQDTAPYTCSNGDCGKTTAQEVVAVDVCKCNFATLADNVVKVKSLGDGL